MLTILPGCSSVHWLEVPCQFGSALSRAQDCEIEMDVLRMTRNMIRNKLQNRQTGVLLTVGDRL